MSSAAYAFSSSGSPAPKRNHRPGSHAAPTSAAADSAIREIVDRRRKRHKYGVQPELKVSPIEGAVSDIVSALEDLRSQAGVPRWAVGSVVLLAAVVGTWFMLGSSLFPEGPPCPVHPVVGRVTFGKIVPSGAQVFLHPVGHELPDKALPRGTVQEDGSFAVSTFGTSDGAPEGQYVVTVQWFRVGKDGSAGPNVLPSRYASAGSSPLKVAVNPGSNELPRMDIVR